MTITGLEEHYLTDDVAKAWQRLDAQWQDPSTVVPDGELGRRLFSLGDERLTAMDSAGVDMQVLSLTTPGLFNLDAADADTLQVACNDRVAEAVARHPDRLQGFATLAPHDADSAAAELRRAVSELDFNGALIFSRVQGVPIDDTRFWPVFEAAEALGAPLYLHPQAPPAAVRGAYYSGLGDAVDATFANYGIGWHYDAGVQFVRLVLAGVFDRFPGLQVILGHWGEVVAFYLERIDLLAHFANLPRPVSEYVRSNVFVTPAGMYSQRYLRWATEVVGIDRILFAADYPFVPSDGGLASGFLADADLSADDRDKIASGNWERLREGIQR